MFWYSVAGETVAAGLLLDGDSEVVEMWRWAVTGLWRSASVTQGFVSGNCWSIEMTRRVK